MQLLKSALFWRILVSFLIVVSALGWGLERANRNYEELEGQFQLLVQHDLKLADDAEVLLRIMVDLESGKQGYLLTHDRTFLGPYETARRDVASVLVEAKRVAESGREDDLVDSFAHDLDDWIASIVEPEINGRVPSDPDAARGKVLVDRMRANLGNLRDKALDAAVSRERRAFDATATARETTRTFILFAILFALGAGVLIARDTAQAAGQLQEAIAATGRLEELPNLPTRRDELGAVADSLRSMARLLRDKDASLRATLAARERTLLELTDANAELAARDAAGREYAEFVTQLKTLDLTALSRNGLEGLMSLAGARVGVTYLLDEFDRLAAQHRSPIDSAELAPLIPTPESLPAVVTRNHEPMMLGPEELGDVQVDSGLAKIPIRWLLATPVAAGDEGAGAVVLAGLAPLTKIKEGMVRDAARQLGAALHNAWTHERLRVKSRLMEEQGRELQRAGRVKSEFLATMSHELRTPLSAMIGFAELLLDSPREQLSPRAHESLERIKRNGEHLLGLINDVLDLARVEAGRLEVRPSRVNVVQLARACVAEVDSLRVGKDLKLDLSTTEAAIEISTDAQRLKQILLNLLSNALKFTEKGGVTMSLEAGAAQVFFHVIDTGIGIPEHALNELFREFHQLDVGDGRRFDGSGIGLSLSRRLARALGGDILVRSEKGKGSVFTLALPLEVPRELLEGAQAGVPIDGGADRAALLASQGGRERPHAAASDDASSLRPSLVTAAWARAAVGS